MIYKSWNTELEVGIRAIDDDHRELFNVANALTQANYQEEALDLLKELRYESARHFADEEGLLEESHYPGLGRHRRIHADFIQQLDTIILQSEMDNYILTHETRETLRMWLVTHLKADDLLYAEFLNCRKVI